MQQEAVDVLLVDREAGEVSSVISLFNFIIDFMYLLGGPRGGRGKLKFSLVQLKATVSVLDLSKETNKIFNLKLHKNKQKKQYN